MSVMAESNRRFLETARAKAAEDWDSLLIHQVDFGFPQELQFLFMLPKWQRATSILDAGCGNGYFLSKLQEIFPDKSYRGVDISPELVRLAAKRHAHLDIALGDLVSYAPRHRFDIIFMRFLIQHLKDFGSVLGAADRLLADDGRLVMIESDLSRSILSPALPMFTGMLTAYLQTSGAHGGVKQRLLDSAADLVAEASSRWEVELERDVPCPAIGPFRDTKLLAIYRLWLDLCEDSGMFSFNFAGVRDELARWAEHPTAFSSVALRVFVLRKADQPRRALS